VFIVLGMAVALILFSARPGASKSRCSSDRPREDRWHFVNQTQTDSLSPSAQHVLELARQAALSLNHDAVGAEHLLAAVLKLNAGPASTALKDAGLSLPSLREEIEAARGVCTREKAIGRIPYTPRCNGIVRRAQDRIRRLANARVEVEDLLLELMAEKDGLPAQIFRKRAIDVAAIQSAVLKARAQ